MRRRLDVGGASGSAVASTLEVCACRIGHTGLTIVVGDHFGFRLDRRRKVFGQHTSNAEMKLLALRTERFSVGYVTQARVFKQKGRVRQNPRQKQKPTSDYSLNCPSNLHPRLPLYKTKQCMWIPAPVAPPNLPSFLGNPAKP